MHSQVKPLAAAIMLVFGASAWAQDSPPPSGEATHIEALVNKAAALVQGEGKVAAFARFRTPNSEWWSGTTYLFAYDNDLNVLLNPAFPKREGTNVHGQTDANGTATHDEFMKAVRTKGSGRLEAEFS